VGGAGPVASAASAPGLLHRPVLGVPVHGASGVDVAGQALRPLPRPAKGERRPFPDWASYRPNSIWIYDSTHFTRCGMPS